MKIKQINYTDYIQYKKPSMFIGTAVCDWKCDKLNGCQACQNMPLATAPTIEIEDKVLVERYMNNPLTHAVVLGGLEPADQTDELISLVAAFRECTADDIVIYTGYYKEEILPLVKQLSQFPNIIVKYGRFVMNQKPHYDEILGVNLANDEQYAERIS